MAIHWRQYRLHEQCIDLNGIINALVASRRRRYKRQAMKVRHDFFISLSFFLSGLHLHLSGFSALSPEQRVFLLLASDFSPSFSFRKAFFLIFFPFIVFLAFFRGQISFPLTVPLFFRFFHEYFSAKKKKTILFRFFVLPFFVSLFFFPENLFHFAFFPDISPSFLYYFFVTRKSM